ncbi:fasciclin domain-containing protein [Paradesertivirga mongoliensis]|uniref:Fasciclin domain-containing protein n=1 Tax=Paradesertivirga mongoliensis TaxID=2100740 RepID=A0ABW4ZJS2_9SPHI|nr:fasciclin domain-containing protein [Pedobacter mongoliensis]
MKKIKLYTWKNALGVLLLLLTMVGCKKEPIVSMVSDQVNITGYLDKNPDQFSEFRKILEITDTDGFLQAYGNYTLFLPTNDGIKKYLADMGKTSVEQISVDELRDMVRFHLLEDTISTVHFGDSKLNSLTMLGQYLITGVNTSGGQTSISINRQANLEASNIRLGNGYVHVIDNVLRQAKLTVAQMLEAKPGYTIFTQALKETGLYDTLNILPASNSNTDQKFLTLLAESDQTLSAEGLGTYELLKAKYNKGVTDLKDPANGLHAYVAYHILYGAKYFADIATTQAQQTLASPEIIQTDFVNDQILINDMVFNGTYEPGVLLTRTNSDNSAVNGVLHNVSGYTPVSGTATTGHFAIKKREPFPVYWDVADFPETRANVAKFRTPGAGSFDFRKTSKTAPSPLKDWDWATQIYGPNYVNATGAWVYGDYLNLPLGVKSRNDWMRTKTPLIVRGTYNVWVCYRRQNQSGRWPNRIGTKARILIDDVALPKPFFFAEPPPPGNTVELAALGWKYYTSNGNAAAPFEKQRIRTDGQTDNSPWVAKNIGVIEIKTTDTHTMLLEALQDSQSQNNLDMIHFIPVTWDSQILPRFKPDGTPDFTDYPGDH